MVANQLFPLGLGDNPNEIKTSFLKVRGKTLIFQNSIYQIANISSIDLLDLSTTKPVPAYLYFLFFVGIILIFVPDNAAKLLGIVVLGLVVWLFFRYQRNKIRTRYRLSIGLNSGTRTIVVSSDMQFLTKVMLVLNNIMNNDELRAVNFNFDQRQIEDRSINVDQMFGSNLITGSVVGDVASNV